MDGGEEGRDGGRGWREEDLDGGEGGRPVQGGGGGEREGEESRRSVADDASNLRPHLIELHRSPITGVIKILKNK